MKGEGGSPNCWGKGHDVCGLLWKKGDLKLNFPLSVTTVKGEGGKEDCNLC